LAAAALPLAAPPEGAAPCGLLENRPMLATLRSTRRHARAG
jgi:hypothetical protein